MPLRRVGSERGDHGSGLQPAGGAVDTSAGIRRLNGDENDQGNYWRFDQWQVKIEKAALYKFN